MEKKEKMVAAALAAVQMYLEEEAALLQAGSTISAAPAVEPGAWAQFGRSDMMNGRRMMQMRAFAPTR